MKIAIYTSIVGNYDDLPQPAVVDDSFDFFCFTNDYQEERKGVWTIRKIPYESDDPIRLSRFAKLMPHVVLPDYTYSVWLDANLKIQSHDFYDVISKHVESGILLGQVPHCVPWCDCIYDDMKMCIRANKVNALKVLPQYIHLKRKHFPEHYGLCENNVILRKHNESVLKRIDEEWWREYCKYTRRDQFSLMYVLWKCGLKGQPLFGNDCCARNISCVEYVRHKGNGKSNLQNLNKVVRGINKIVSWWLC